MGQAAVPGLVCGRPKHDEPLARTQAKRGPGDRLVPSLELLFEVALQTPSHWLVIVLSEAVDSSCSRLYRCVVTGFLLRGATGFFAPGTHLKRCLHEHTEGTTRQLTKILLAERNASPNLVAGVRLHKGGKIHV